MIDNIVLLITGTLHQRAISELIPKCHPLGSFEQMEAIHIASSPAELYNAVLVDTPLGIYSSLLFEYWCQIFVFFTQKRSPMATNVVVVVRFSIP